MEGVASLVDTIFLILLASIAATMLFYTGSTYGKTVLRYLDQLFVDYYAKQVLRVITSVSIQRGGTYDYLLAYLKESVERTGEITSDAASTLNDVLSKALMPLSRTYDYFIYFDFRGGIDRLSAVGTVRRVVGSHLEEYQCTCNLDADGRDQFLAWIDGIQRPYAASTYLFFRFPENGSVRYVPVLTKLVLWPAGLEGERISQLMDLCDCVRSS